MHHDIPRALGRRAIASCSLSAAALFPGTAIAHRDATSATPHSMAAVAETTTVHVAGVDSLFGRSGKLRFRLFSSTQIRSGT